MTLYDDANADGGFTDWADAVEHQPVSDEPVVEPEPDGDDYPEDGPTFTEKLDYIYESVVKIRELIDQLKPEEIERVQKTMANPLVKKLMGLK